MPFYRLLSFFILCLSCATLGRAASPVETRDVEYMDGADTLQGFVAFPTGSAGEGARPGVLIVHDWTGLQEYTKSRARQIAELGYVAFCADIYGKGVRPTDPKECSAQAGSFKSDLPRLRRRVTLALAEMRKLPQLDGAKVAAIGYCFGGTTALELARSGADVRGVVSFHGGLGSSMPAAADTLKARILVLHGADDPFVPAREVAAFRAEMEAAQGKYEFVAYPGAVHSFTQPHAGNDPKKGAAYQAEADKASWEAMKGFFAEILK